MNNLKKKIISDVLRKCLDNKCIYLELKYLALLGSTRTSEDIEEYSDLDILLVLKSDTAGVIKKKTILELKKVSEDLSGKYNVELSLLTHTIFDFKEYVDFNSLYLDALHRTKFVFLTLVSDTSSALQRGSSLFNPLFVGQSSIWKQK